MNHDYGFKSQYYNILLLCTFQLQLNENSDVFT